MRVTVRGLAVRGTERPRGLDRSGIPRAAARMTTSASRCSPFDTTTVPDVMCNVSLDPAQHAVCKP